MTWASWWIAWWKNTASKMRKAKTGRWLIKTKQRMGTRAEKHDMTEHVLLRRHLFEVVVLTKRAFPRNSPFKACHDKDISVFSFLCFFFVMQIQKFRSAPPVSLLLFVFVPAFFQLCNFTNYPKRLLFPSSPIWVAQEPKIRSGVIWASSKIISIFCSPTSTYVG